MLKNFLGFLPTSIVCVVAAYLCFEVSAFGGHSGPLENYENSDSVYERGVQVSAVAFAVATLLLSQPAKDMAKIVTRPVLLALLFCTIASVPSSIARKQFGASGTWSAIQRAAISYSAGLLCVAIAMCLQLQ